MPAMIRVMAKTTDVASDGDQEAPPAKLQIADPHQPHGGRV